MIANQDSYEKILFFTGKIAECQQRAQSEVKKELDKKNRVWTRIFSILRCSSNRFMKTGSHVFFYLERNWMMIFLSILFILNPYFSRIVYMWLSSDVLVNSVEKYLILIQQTRKKYVNGRDDIHSKKFLKAQSRTICIHKRDWTTTVVWKQKKQKVWALDDKKSVLNQNLQLFQILNFWYLISTWNPF